MIETFRHGHHRMSRKRVLKTIRERKRKLLREGRAATVVTVSHIKVREMLGWPECRASRETGISASMFDAIEGLQVAISTEVKPELEFTVA